MPPRSLPFLQSRLLAYVFTLCVLSATWSAHHVQLFAHAADLPAALEARDTDPSTHHVAPALALSQDGDENTNGDGGYAPEFGYFDRSILGRQDAQMKELKNNEKTEMDINPGTTSYFVMKRGQPRIVRAEDAGSDALDARSSDNASEEAGLEDSADLEKRQGGNTIYISANTCRQPMPSANNTNNQRPRNNPQLVMYVSTQNQKPGPDSTDNLATDPTGVLFDSGFANFSLQANSDVYIGISAPNLDKDWFGSWHFEVAASTDGSYHSYNDTNPFLFMVDTDSESALFITYNLSDTDSPNSTERWKENNPFEMYAFPAGADSPIMGVEHSYCAIKTLFNKTNNLTTVATITNKFGAGLPKSQFHIQGLDNGKVYNGFLVVNGNQTETMRLPGVGQVRGGGKVFQQFNWTTKVEDSCQVLFDLEFCDNVAYAVPSSPEFKLDDDKLKKIYDDQAKSYYANFTNSLAQIACDTTSDAQYSLARTCKDCERDYKNWLCSVLIPRCEDWNADDDFLQPRNVNAPFANGTVMNFNETDRQRFAFSQSRNPMIDEMIKPGPYKEMKPCEDLCFDIVRSCPAKLGFGCPSSPAREVTYGQRDPDQNTLMCNFPGAVVKLNFQGAAGMLSARVHIALFVASIVAMVSWL